MPKDASENWLVSIRGFIVGADMWFEMKPGFSVIYGKNGVGKSTAVNFIEAISHRVVTQQWNEDEVHHQSVERNARSDAERANGRVVVKFVLPKYVAFAVEIANEVSRTEKPVKRKVSFISRWHPAQGITRVAHYLADNTEREIRWTDERVYAGIARVLEESPEQVQRDIQSVERWLEETDTRLPINIVRWVTKNILQRESNPESVSEFSDSIRETVLYHYTEWSPESAEIALINQRLSTYGVDGKVDLDEPMLSRNSIKNLLFGDLFLLFIDVVICRLQYELNEVEYDVQYHMDVEPDSLADLGYKNPLTFSSVRDDADEIIGIVARAIYAESISPLVSYSRHNGPLSKRSLHLLFTVSDKDGVGEPAVRLEKLRESFNLYREEHDLITLKEAVRDAWLNESSVLDSEKLTFGSQFTELLPYYELKFPLGQIDELPSQVFRLDENFDIDQVLSEIAAVTVKNELFEALAVLNEYEETGDQLSEFIKPLNKVFEPVSKFVVSLGIGIDGMRIEVSPRISDWVTGQGVKLMFLTATSERNFVQLSTAQQFWVKAGMWLVAAQKADGRVLVVADEPDRSLHERAAFNVMEALADSGLDVIVSSHSVAALRTRNAVLHHLEVGPDGRRTLSEVAVGQDVLVAAERFGTTPYDLLSLKRVMILVEGAHDAAVVNRLLRLSENKLLEDRVLVAPMRGVKNVVSAADSVLVTEFSELNILIVVDNGRNEVFKPILADLRERDSAGASEKELKQILTAYRMGADVTFEERMLFDLLERAIHRGILRRLDLFALSVGDVIELLPVAGFGSSEGWEELRQQYRISGLRTDFKSWLRENHQISVSVRAVEKAFDNSDSVHPELTRLLQQIELGCMAGKVV